MLRRLLCLSAVAALAACGEAAPGPGKAAAPARPPAPSPLIISGVVEAPQGQTLDGAVVMLCLTPRETCAREAKGPVTVAGGVGRYEVIAPAAGDYHVMVWKDVNGDEAPNEGDILAFANNMEAVPAGQRLTPMTAFVRGPGEMVTNTGGAPLGSAAELAAAARSVAAAGLGGRWSQASTGSELVWGPEIKFQASSATVGFGTNLGGTFGAGSPTNTTIVYSYKPMRVSRTMALDVQPDGAFVWTTTMERRQGDCRAVRQQKRGRVMVEDGRLTFVVVEALQGCGGGRMERLEAKPETYAFTRAGEGFRLTGDKGVDWTFSAG